jgi:hypothetical protein
MKEKMLLLMMMTMMVMVMVMAMKGSAARLMQPGDVLPQSWT